jgi:hypothetical protein
VVDVAAVVAAAADVVRSIGRVATQDEKSGTRRSGPAFSSRGDAVQRERSRGRRTRRKKIPMSIAPIPIIASAGSIVAVFGAIIPSAIASSAVIAGSGDADSPFDVRESGAPPEGGTPALDGDAA